MQNIIYNEIGRDEIKRRIRMGSDYRYHKLFEAFLKATNDGFIVIDSEGIITDINDNYCNFLGKSQEEVIGRPIREIVSTTSMYDVLERRQVKENEDGIYLHPYVKEDNENRVDTFAVGNRFCFFNDEGEVLGAAAQVVYKERTVAMTNSLKEWELDYYKEEYLKNNFRMGGFDNILGVSKSMKELKRHALKMAKRDFPVLITGETGTGKELFAKALHMESNRKHKPMISINCAAIPADLLESELFGYESGAFTGALKGGKMGKFQLADGGTIFLDEIGDMALPLQAKLLRVLQEKQIEKVGGGMPIPIDVRIISATRQNLEEMIEEGTFREDLYYRLNVINLDIIPLRERKEDVLILANQTLNDLNRQYKTCTILSDGVKKRLIEYSWPGNVRELINIITSAYASSDLEMIDEMDLPSKLITATKTDEYGMPIKRLSDMMSEYETMIIRDALRRNDYVCRHAAEELGIDRSLLYKKMRKSGIELKRIIE